MKGTCPEHGFVRFLESGTPPFIRNYAWCETKGCTRELVWTRASRKRDVYPEGMY